MFFKSHFSQRQELAKKRLEICESCEFFQPRFKRCSECGCFMEFKAMMVDAQCPRNKWDVINNEEVEGEQTNG